MDHERPKASASETQRALQERVDVLRQVTRPIESTFTFLPGDSLLIGEGAGIALFRRPKNREQQVAVLWDREEDLVVVREFPDHDYVRLYTPNEIPEKVGENAVFKYDHSRVTDIFVGESLHIEIDLVLHPDALVQGMGMLATIHTATKQYLAPQVTQPATTRPFNALTW
jgi:hypothetical protein